MYTVDCVMELSPTIPNIAQGGFVRYMYLPIILLITPVVLIPEGDEMPFLTFEILLPSLSCLETRPRFVQLNSVCSIYMDIKNLHVHL